MAYSTKRNKQIRCGGGGQIHRERGEKRSEHEPAMLTQGGEGFVTAMCVVWFGGLCGFLPMIILAALTPHNSCGYRLTQPH